MLLPRIVTAKILGRLFSRPDVWSSQSHLKPNPFRDISTEPWAPALYLDQKWGQNFLAFFEFSQS